MLLFFSIYPSFPDFKQLLLTSVLIVCSEMFVLAKNTSSIEVLYDGTFSKPHFSNSVFE